MAARLLGLWVRIPPGTRISVSCECRVCQAEVSATSLFLVCGVLPAMVRRCVWSRHIMIEEAIIRFGPQHQKKKKNIYMYIYIYIYTYIYIYICVCGNSANNQLIYIYIHTGCPRRNVPDFGRVFLMLKYTDITQNTYVQS